MSVEFLLGFAGGIAATATTIFSILYFRHLNYRLKNIETFIRDFPSPEEMARIVLNTKLPVNELPPNFKDNVIKAFNKVKNNEQDNESNNIVNEPLDGMSYVG